MAVSPLNISRVSYGLRTDLILNSLRSNQLDMLRSQIRISTGRSFLAPSENPIAASRVVDLTQTLALQSRLMSNLQHGDNFMSASDSAITELSSLLIDASVIASQNVGGLVSADEREAEADLVAAIRHQLQTIGNQTLNGKYIFAGRATTSPPFVDALGGVAYVGDTGERFTRVSAIRLEAVNIPGNILFNALSKPITTDVDLTPNLAETVRLEDLRGAAGEGIRKGMLTFNDTSGGGPFFVDLSDADTIGDVATLINEAAVIAGSDVTASVTDTGLEITSTPQITISDTGNGAIAADLGIRIITPTSGTITGEDLLPRVTRLTPIDDLGMGTGIDIANGLIISNGSKTVSVDFSTAETVQDLINTLNNAGVFVLAKINDAGTGIDVFNRVSGVELRIGENNGTTAADLGIRTFDAATKLDELNFGLGVVKMDGQDDFQIIAKDGNTVDVNIDSAQTVGDVIDLINTAATTAGVNITASFTTTGNGIRIQDATGGGGNLTVGLLNLSQAAMDLGIKTTVLNGGSELIGEDVNPKRTDGIIDALVDLEKALRDDNTQGITFAGERIDTLRNEVIRVHGVVGARAQAMNSQLLQMEDASITTEIFLSEVRDLDYAEAITRLQASTIQLQASLQTSSLLLNLTLMDFL